MKHIRNIALVGATGSGKTSLVEQMLFNAKAISRLGKIEDGNTVMDFNQEEIDKGMSMTLAIANLEWKNNKINLIDTPGYADFAGDQLFATKAVETICWVANGAAGFEVSLEQSIEMLSDFDVAKAIIVNRLDNEGADLTKCLDLIRENSELNPVVLYLPIGAESKFEGIVDIVKSKAMIGGKEVAVPASMTEQLEESKLALMEAVAETDDALLENYFEEGELNDQQLIAGLKAAIASNKLLPVFTCSATHNIAVDALLNGICEYLPSPADRNQIPVLEKGEAKVISANPDGELLAYIFKSYSDPNVGDVCYARVYSGIMTSGTDVFIAERDSKDRIGTINFIRGKNRDDASELVAGDIGGLVKLKVGRSLNTITSTSSNLMIPAPPLPTPVFWQTIKAVNQSDEDKIGAALNKLLDEDQLLSLDMNSETSENVLSGIGEQQIGLIKKKLKSRYKIEAELATPSVPYKETIKGFADVSYRHKKQSGGKGQYGEVYFKVRPLERGEGFEFINGIVGGTIPSKFIPAIEKGLNEILAKGIVSGNPIVDLSVEVYFGSYHDVDSSEMAFKIATWQCLKKAFETAGHILLEPVHNVQIIIPNEYMGDVMGDVSTRRGRIMGMEQKGKKQILNAQMPLAELFNYYPALKSLTQGRGKFIQTFSHFERVPGDIAAKVIAAANERE